MTRRCHAILGVPTTWNERTDLIALAPLRHAGTELDYRSGYFQTRQIGCAGRRRVRAGALEAIGTIYAGCRDANQHFAGLGLRYRPRRRAQDFWTAWARNFHDLHGIWNGS